MFFDLRVLGFLPVRFCIIEEHRDRHASFVQMTSTVGLRPHVPHPLTLSIPPNRHKISLEERAMNIGTRCKRAYCMLTGLYHAIIAKRCSNNKKRA